MFTIRKSFSAVLRRSTYFKGFFRFISRTASLIPSAKQIKIGSIVLVNHYKIDDITLINQKKIDDIELVDQYKIGDIEFVC
jgi:hypothetical protein